MVVSNLVAGTKHVQQNISHATINPTKMETRCLEQTVYVEIVHKKILIPLRSTGHDCILMILARPFLLSHQQAWELKAQLPCLHMCLYCEKNAEFTQMLITMFLDNTQTQAQRKLAELSPSLMSPIAQPLGMLSPGGKEVAWLEITEIMTQAASQGLCEPLWVQS